MSGHTAAINPHGTPHCGIATGLVRSYQTCLHTVHTLNLQTPHTDGMADVLWLMRYGRSGMADAVWPMRYRRCGMADAVWPMRYGRSGMADAVWPMRYGRSGMTDAVWPKRYD